LIPIAPARISVAPASDIHRLPIVAIHQRDESGFGCDLTFAQLVAAWRRFAKVWQIACDSAGAPDKQDRGDDIFHAYLPTEMYRDQLFAI
jgi:hypothetical protein